MVTYSTPKSRNREASRVSSESREGLVRAFWSAWVGSLASALRAGRRADDTSARVGIISVAVTPEVVHARHATRAVSFSDPFPPALDDPGRAHSRRRPSDFKTQLAKKPRKNNRPHGRRNFDTRVRLPHSLMSGATSCEQRCPRDPCLVWATSLLGNRGKFPWLLVSACFLVSVGDPKNGPRKDADLASNVGSATFGGPWRTRKSRSSRFCTSRSWRG